MDRINLNSKSHLLSAAPNTIASNADLNDFRTPGIYDCGSASVARSLLHGPEGLASGFRLIVELTGYGTIAYGYQTIMLGSANSSSGGQIYRRVLNGTASAGTWTNWFLQPTRAEMDALTAFENFNSKVTFHDITPTASYNGYLTIGKIGVLLFDFISPSEVTADKKIATLPTGYGAVGRNVVTISKAWEKDKTAIIHVTGTNVTLAASAWEASTRYVGQCIYIRQ